MWVTGGLRSGLSCRSSLTSFNGCFRKLFWHSSGVTGCCCWNSSYLLGIQTDPLPEFEGESQIAKIPGAKNAPGQKAAEKKKSGEKKCYHKKQVQKKSLLPEFPAVNTSLNNIFMNATHLYSISSNASAAEFCAWTRPQLILFVFNPLWSYSGGLSAVTSTRRSSRQKNQPGEQNIRSRCL